MGLAVPVEDLLTLNKPRKLGLKCCFYKLFASFVANLNKFYTKKIDFFLKSTIKYESPPLWTSHPLFSHPPRIKIFWHPHHFRTVKFFNPPVKVGGWHYVFLNKLGIRKMTIFFLPQSKLWQQTRAKVKNQTLHKVGKIYTFKGGGMFHSSFLANF